MHNRYLCSGSLIILIFLIVLAAQISWTQEEKQQKDPTYLEQYTGKDAELTGSDQCLLCHEDRTPTKARSHLTLLDDVPKNPYFGYGCEGCHGPGGTHNGDIAGILQPEKMGFKDVTKLCSKCHSDLRSYNLKKWLLSEHYFEDYDCLICHEGHFEKKMFLKKETQLELCMTCHMRQRAEFKLRSHHPVDEDSMECSSCHNPMSGEFEYQLNNDGDKLCFECHGDKEGPFIYDMDLGTASGGEGCLTCHFAHGSNADQLLRYPRRVCLRCHSEMRAEDHFEGTCWTSGCHVEIHGSNSHPFLLY